MSEDHLQKISQAIVELDYQNITKIVKEALDAGVPPLKVVLEGMAKGMEIVGQKYEANEYFLSELIMAGEVMKEGMKIVEPLLKDAEKPNLGTVVIGTVKGDLHDIGKNIVATLLSAAGFNVIDLGVDVAPEKFIEAVEKYNPQIVGMSALLTVTMPAMKDVIDLLKKRSLREKVKVIIGGAAVTPEFAKKIGADAAPKDAVEAVQVSKKLLGFS